MTTTRKKIKEKVEGMINKLQAIEIQAVEIGMLTDNSDAEIAGVMYAVSLATEALIPLLQKASEEL